MLRLSKLGICDFLLRGCHFRSTIADLRLQLEETRQEKAQTASKASALQEQLDAAIQQISTIAGKMADATADTRGRNDEVNNLQDQLAARAAQLNEQDRSLEEARCFSVSTLQRSPCTPNGSSLTI